MSAAREVEALVQAGEVERAAALARDLKQWRRAAQLYAALGRTSQAVLAAVEDDAWQLAVDIALESQDTAVLDTLIEAASRDPVRAAQTAGQARVHRRDDVAARVLEASVPEEAAGLWYARGEYLRAAGCYERAGRSAQARRAYEQHLDQDPADADAAERLAALRALQGDDPGAVRALQAAVRVSPTPGRIAKLVAGLGRMGLEHAARRWIATLRDNDPTAPAEVSAYAQHLPRGEAEAKRYAGRYRVVREVGSGATGRVLEAVDELTGEAVALKILSVSDDRSAAFSRFMREAELARSLDDPTLVRMRDLDPEGPTIVYDWMPGGTLAERIGRQALPEVRAVVWRVMAALETLHRNGVVHRDVKPSNVLFDPAGQARLGDLGAAHLGDLGATVTGGLVGSLPYMAPEQVTGGAVSAATDLYALGCMLFQMLTGSLPFAGPDFVAQHLSEAPPLASARAPGLPPDFDAPLVALLAKDQDARPPDVAALRALLQPLPWDAVWTPPAAVAEARVSIPPPMGGRGEDGRFVPSEAVEGLWRDTVLLRDVERLRVPRAQRATVQQWAAGGFTVLQPVLDLHDDDPDFDVWTLGALEGRRVSAATLAPAVSAALGAALAAVGVDGVRPEGLTVYWNGYDATLGLAAVLAVRGVSFGRG